MPVYTPIEVVLISSLVSITLGFIWYGPLFGATWMKQTGIATPDNKPTFGTMLPSILFSFLGTLFLSFTLMSVIEFHNAYFSGYGLVPNLSLAFFLWLGFFVPVYLNQKAWEGRSWSLFAINSGYWLVMLCIIALLTTHFVPA